MQTPHSSRSDLRPMGWQSSILHFGVPALAMVLATYLVTPALVSLGMLPFYAQMLPNCVVLIIMLAAAIWAYRLEGRAFVWSGVKERFRLYPLTGRTWLWALGAGALSFVLYGLASGLGQWLIEAGWMPLPVSLPAWLDPRVSLPWVERFSREAGGLQGNWLAFAMAAIMFFFNIVGEEFWWRGYILPRQELALGKWTWLVHGVMWAFFHLFKWWDVIGLLPGCVLLSYVVWRKRNTTIGVVMHIMSNVGFPALVLLGVLGMNL